MGFPLLTFIGALIVWRFRARIFSFAVRGLAEGDQFHVGHEEELRRESGFLGLLSFEVRS